MNTSVARTIEINTDHIAYDASCKRLRKAHPRLDHEILRI
mgnify:CR=1 FL=1